MEEEKTIAILKLVSYILNEMALMVERITLKEKEIGVASSEAKIIGGPDTISLIIRKCSKEQVEKFLKSIFEFTEISNKFSQLATLKPEERMELVEKLKKLSKIFNDLIETLEEEK